MVQAMIDATDAITISPVETDETRGRAEVLEWAGYPRVLARELADVGADLSLAVQLARAGIPPQLAARIVG